ncbi:MAG: hypothetical protein ACRC7O_03125 [Fimbriiglobus sp.]
MRPLRGKQLIGVLGLLAGVAVAFFLGADWLRPQALSAGADRLILISIDGRDPPLNGENPRKGTTDLFYRYPVLGSVEVTDREARRAILADLNRGMADKNATLAKCFWPRHGVRVMKNGTVTDLVICFECGHVRFMATETEHRTVPTSRFPQRTLNDILRAANIPLAPGMSPDP